MSYGQHTGLFPNSQKTQNTEIPTIIDPSATINYPSATINYICGHGQDRQLDQDQSRAVFADAQAARG